jgi:flagellar biosynthesis protein FlhF
VGKTTTIAKLAALSKLSHGCNVGLISADTYRIGAIEQLRTFAGIADIPMEVVYEPSDMGPALARFQDKDVVYVDTVGRSQRGEKDLAELKQFLDASGPDEVHLVLSAPTGVPTQLEVVDRFRTLQPNRLLFSKLDEVAAAGPLARVARETGIPLSYVTTGQTVPDDILQADARGLATMIYTGALPHA